MKRTISTKMQVECPVCKAKFEMETGFAEDAQAEVPEEVDGEAGLAAATEEKIPGLKEEAVEKPEDDGEKGRSCREFKRVRFKKKVLVDNQIMVEALDLSENGLFLHTGRSFEDGAIVEVSIPTLPGYFDLRVRAQVKHNHPSIGMGLEFVDLDEKQKIQLHRLISELDEEAAKELEGRKKILLVGGTETERNINKSKLVLDGFYVMQATTADAIFCILENESPDAMVIDWQEKTFNCKDMLIKIKESPKHDSIIMVVLSALTDAFLQKEILDAGAHWYMAKMDTTPAKLSLILSQLIDNLED